MQNFGEICFFTSDIELKIRLSLLSEFYFTWWFFWLLIYLSPDLLLVQTHTQTYNQIHIHTKKHTNKNTKWEITKYILCFQIFYQSFHEYQNKNHKIGFVSLGLRPLEPYKIGFKFIFFSFYICGKLSLIQCDK